MRVEVIEGRKAIAELRPHWQSVYQADPEANYFLSFEWQFGTAESAGSGGFVLAVRAPHDDSDFVAFLPIRLFTEFETEGYHNELHLTGNKTSDYNGFICRPEFDETAIPAFATILRGMNWRHLSLRYIPTSEKRLRLFLSPFSAEVVGLKRLSMVEPDGTDNGVCPYADLAEDWDEFLQQSVSAKTRQKIRRFLRKVEGSDAYRITHTTGETLDRDIEILNRLWERRWGESKGDRLENILRTTRLLLRSAFHTKTLFMPMLWHGTQPVCVLALLVDHQKKAYNFLIGGRDLSFKGLPSGLVLHSYAIRHAISHGINRYEFLRGNEPYKYAFATGEVKLRSLLISTRSGRNIGEKLDRRCLPYVYRRSKKVYRAGDLPAAKRGFEQILQVLPRNARVLYLNGVVAARLADYDTARRDFTKLMGWKPNSLKTWLRLETVRVACLKPAAEPENISAGVLEKFPDEPKVPLLLGRALLKLGLAGHAVTVFEAAVRLHPGNEALRAARATAQRSQRAALAKRQEKRMRRQARIDAAMGKAPAVFGGVARSSSNTIASNAGDLDYFPFLAMRQQRTETALARIMARSRSAR